MKTYVFDIDGTICTLSNGKYEDAKPLKERIAHVNNLYDEGNTVIFQTARGMGRFKNNKEKAEKLFYELTVKQLNSWGVKYHELFLGKPAGDFYIDDKGVNDKDYFNSEVSK